MNRSTWVALAPLRIALAKVSHRMQVTFHIEPYCVPFRFGWTAEHPVHASGAGGGGIRLQDA